MDFARFYALKSVLPVSDGTFFGWALRLSLAKIPPPLEILTGDFWSLQLNLVLIRNGRNACAAQQRQRFFKREYLGSTKNRS